MYQQEQPEKRGWGYGGVGYVGLRVRTDTEAGVAWELRTRWGCLLVPRPLGAEDTVVNTEAGALPSW